MLKILTIVIPTYNMESYLHKCLDSLIVSEEFRHQMEVLVINDGSKDHSSEIAHSYQEKYPETFRVIDKRNGNYGSCVNRGLKEATGKYIKILDADDSFQRENLSALITLLADIDVDAVITDYITVGSDDTQKEEKKYSIPQMQELLFREEQHKLYKIQMHALTYRTQMLRDINYEQTEGISYTDQEWTCIGLSSSITLFYYPHVIYRYLVEREGRTMAPEQFYKAASQWLLIANRLLDYKLDIPEASSFVDFRVFDLYYDIYIASLFRGGLDNETLIKMDRHIKKLDEKMYERLGLSSFSLQPIIADWRENRYHISSLMMFKLKMIKMKRRYLPWLKLGINFKGE